MRKHRDISRTDPARRARAAAVVVAALSASLGGGALASPGDGASPTPETPGPQTPAPLPSARQVLTEGAPIAPEAWRALTQGRTVWYFASDGYWGREVYLDKANGVTFEHRDGDCMDGDWRFAEGLYCFDFRDGGDHCFRHMRWQDRTFAVSISGDVQEVRRIDSAPLTCGAMPTS